MQGLSENIIENNSNLISRNTPVALIVGVAGFLGSNLAEQLLSKNIQVVGVDNFSTGRKENLSKCIRDRKFHLINKDAADLQIQASRLDYIFIISGGGWNIDNVLEIARDFSSKVVFVSTIELYVRDPDPLLHWFKYSEAKIAKFATENKLNARIVRLGSIFGPKMHFRVDDPMVKLINNTLSGELQREPASLEFSSRALFVDDAINLIIKSMLSGSTAQRIFDGVGASVKVSEIKEVLIDPIWHENRGFVPSELPPWATPNLGSTIRHLSWRPQTNLVRALRLTLHYFKENEIKVPKIEVKVEEGGNEFKDKLKEWKEDLDRGGEEKSKKKSLGFSRQKLGLVLIWAFILYVLFYPVLGLSWNVGNLRNNLNKSINHLSSGEIDLSLTDMSKAKENLQFIEGIVDSFNGLELGKLSERLGKLKKLLAFYAEEIKSFEHALGGSKTLYDSFRIVSGESNGNLKENLNLASSELESSYVELSSLALDAKNASLKLDFLSHDYYFNLVEKNKVAAKLLLQTLPQDSKSYLLLIEDNRKLIGAGGKIVALNRVDFKNGKLVKVEAQASETLEDLKLHVEPPKDIKIDLGINEWRISDSNYEPDFPTSARQTAWFYTKATGKSIDGILAIDLSAIEELLSIIGPINIKGRDEKIDTDNLIKTLNKEKDNKLITDLAEELINKILFLPDLNWPEITLWFGKNFEQKHLLLYFADTKLFSYLVSSGFSASFPRPAEKTEKVGDLLSLVETNIGEGVNFYIDKRYSLETNINKEGKISHFLKLTYTNSSNQALLGKYKVRMRVYFPAGTKLERLSWGEEDLLKETSSFTDYGRGGYSFIFEVLSKEQKTLILEYQVPIKLNIASSTYYLDVLKQPGTSSDSFIWHLKGVKDQIVNTDLSKDKRFEVSFP